MGRRGLSASRMPTGEVEAHEGENLGVNHRSRALRPAAFLIAVVLAGAAYHAYAVKIERRARDRSVRAVLRLDDARLATRLEPFNRRFEVTYTIVRAEALYDLGAELVAYDLMHPDVAEAVVDPYFKAVYHDVNQARIRASARKAHVQHGREKAGGVVDDQAYYP